MVAGQFIKRKRGKTMEKKTLHYVHPTGFALGVTSAILYTLCAAAVKLWPVRTISFVNNWFHGIDLMRIFDPTKLTWSAFFRGLISILVIAYLSGLLYAWLYNKCVDHCKKKRWI